MNRLEQSQCFLRQYIKSKKYKEISWISSMSEDRAKWCLQDLGGMAGDWYMYRPYCTYYTPRVENIMELKDE